MPRMSLNSPPPGNEFGGESQHVVGQIVTGQLVSKREISRLEIVAIEVIFHSHHFCSKVEFMGPFDPADVLAKSPITPSKSPLSLVATSK